MVTRPFWPTATHESISSSSTIGPAEAERQAERDDERAASLQEVDACDLFLECSRHRPSYLIAFAPRSTALRIL
jgi:hypothetical protein